MAEHKQTQTMNVIRIQDQDFVSIERNERLRGHSEVDVLPVDPQQVCVHRAVLMIIKEGKKTARSAF